MPIDPVLPRNLDDQFGPGAEQAEIEPSIPEDILLFGELKVIKILETIKGETRPNEGHTDPGAIEDCWNEVFEYLTDLNRKMDKAINDLAHAYPIPASKTLKIAHSLLEFFEEIDV